MNKIEPEIWATALTRITEHPTFKLAFEVAYINSKEGHVYLAGGKVYRSIIEELYGYPARAECCDYDFVTVQTVDEPKLPQNLKPWQAFLNLSNDYNYTESNKPLKMDSPSIQFQAKGVKVDIISLGSLPHILEKNLPRTIESYFDSVPLDIQAIAVDLDIKNGVRLVGGRGQNAILNKVITVNNPVTLEQYCSFKCITQNGFIRKKAKSVRFDWG